MKNTALTIAVILCLTFYAKGQNKTYLGFKFSVGNDLYEIKDNGDYLRTVPLINAQGGFNLRQEIKNHFFIEAGLLMKEYWEGFGFRTIDFYSSSTSDNAWLIPLRFGLAVNLYREKIYLVPIVGYTFGINPPYGYGRGYGTQRSGTTVIDYIYSENPNVSRYFSLLQTGVGFEFRLLKVVIFSVSGNYYTGVDQIIRLDINYTVNNSPPMTGSAITKGQFWSVSTGVKYPISDLWQRKSRQ